MLRSLALYPIEPIGHRYIASSGVRTHARRPELESGALDHSAMLADVCFVRSNNSYATTTGFEPVRQFVSRFLVYRLNHSARLPNVPYEGVSDTGN